MSANITALTGSTWRGPAGSMIQESFPAPRRKTLLDHEARRKAEETFRGWLRSHLDASIGEAIIGLVVITTYDHDPGRRSAAFVSERLLAGSSRYVVGGWSTSWDLLTK
jgi:hypothetical protein